MHTINVTFGVKKRKDSCEILLQCPDMYFTKMMTSVENLDGKSYEEIEDAIAEGLSKLIPKIIQFASRTDSEHPYPSEMKAVCSMGEKKDEEVNRCRDFEAYMHQLIPKDMNVEKNTHSTVSSNPVQPISLPVYAWRCFCNAWKRTLIK